MTPPSQSSSVSFNTKNSNTKEEFKEEFIISD
jgi:hypothetical protein